MAKPHKPMTDAEREELFGKPVRHESFGTISAAHCSGNTQLFQSPHKHYNFVTVTITTAEVRRNLSNDYVYGGGGGEIIAEIAMSEAQWAHFIGAPNQGVGAPCTIRYYRDGDLKKADPPPENAGNRETFSKELEEHAAKALAGVTAALKEMDALLAGGTVSKGALREVRRNLSMALSNSGDAGLGFVLQQGEQWLDKMVESAKTEAEAAMMAGLRNLGLQAVAAEMNPADKERLRDEITKAITHKTGEGET